MVGLGSRRGAGGGGRLAGALRAGDDQVAAEPVQADLLAFQRVARAAALGRVAV